MDEIFVDGFVRLTYLRDRATIAIKILLSVCCAKTVESELNDDAIDRNSKRQAREQDS